jgi:hypothetical protein
LLIKAPKPPESARSAKQKKTHTKLVKSARNPPEIGSPPEIFFARQMTFNPPEFCKSGGENRHLATLAEDRRFPKYGE